MTARAAAQQKPKNLKYNVAFDSDLICKSNYTNKRETRFKHNTVRI